MGLCGKGHTYPHCWPLPVKLLMTLSLFPTKLLELVCVRRLAWKAGGTWWVGLEEMWRSPLGFPGETVLFFFFLEPHFQETTEISIRLCWYLRESQLATSLWADSSGFITVFQLWSRNQAVGEEQSREMAWPREFSSQHGPKAQTQPQGYQRKSTYLRLMRKSYWWPGTRDLREDYVKEIFKNLVFSLVYIMIPEPLWLHFWKFSIGGDAQYLGFIPPSTLCHNHPSQENCHIKESLFWKFEKFLAIYLFFSQHFKMDM